jgi:glucuronoarabinoxylan endo-1,4-beta-xylanase
MVENNEFFGAQLAANLRRMNMSKKLFFLISFVLMPSVASISYGADPRMIKLDLNNTANNDDANTQYSFTKFVLANSGSEVNGVVIDLGGNLQSARRTDPSGMWSGGVYYPRAGERIYRDFIFGVNPSGVTITLWGLGVNRDCNVTIWAFDNESTEGNRIANWYANGVHILDTNFIGGSANWPNYEAVAPQDLYKWAFSGRATTDYLGRIILTSSRDPRSPADQPFAFVNALQVEPNSLIPFVETKYAHYPVPLDGAEGVPVNVILEWKEGGYAEKHDVYFGTDEAKVADANRSNPLGVLVSENHSATSYNPPEFLDLNTTYYWRIDEVNAAPDYTIFKGEVWSFTTLPYVIIENFNSYGNNSALRSVWEKGSTSAEVSVESTIVRDGNSMKYQYKNNLSPYYSEVCADIADFSIDNPDWLGTGAQSLVLRFYGTPTNPIDEQMYVKLTDGDGPAKTATVMNSNMNDVSIPQWNKWSIALSKFADVNLANVASITIGFGDGGAGEAGVVYFEDIQLDVGQGDEEFTEVDGVVNINTVYQQLEGFGGSACYDAVTLAYHPSREAVYDLLFRDLGMDVLRIKNTYQISSSEITATGLIVAAARQSTRNPNLKLLLVPWSPAAYLKSTGDLGTLNGTLKKDPGDPNNSAPYYYVYKAYANWWLNSLIGSGGWKSVGIYPDYISIQNEPDWGQQDQVCRFRTTENSIYAGYDKAFEAVYNRIDGNVSPMPKMLAPESMGFGGSQAFIDALINRGQINNIYGFSHHLYSDGSYTNPDGMIWGMQNYANNYVPSHGNKPLFQTEYGQSGDPPTFNDAVLMAQHIHNCIVYEGVTSYYQWTSFRNGGYTTGGMINLTPSGGYIIRDLYWFFKAYAYFTDPGWYVTNTSLGETGASDLRMSAFRNSGGDQLTVVVLNKSANRYSLKLRLNGFARSNSEVYRSSETENWLYIGMYGSSLALPGNSITTIHMTGTTYPVPTNCEEVETLGYRLTSDIDGDCYVNYKDLKIITDYWLNDDCTEPGNCGGADFEPTDSNVDLADFSRFAEQWMWCNDPENSGCIANW